jgi:hypothetical protein
MAKKSSSASKKSTTAPKNSSTASKYSSTANRKKTQHTPKKVRGPWLTAGLVLIILHGLVAAVYYFVARLDPSLNRPMILGLMSLHFLANVVAAIAIWYWKQWGIYVYIGSTIVALVVGLVTVGIWATFYMVLPLAILGYLLREKWSYFS